MTDSTQDFTSIEGMLVYVQIDKPVPGYQDPKAPPKPLEYKASVVVTDEDWVDGFEAWCAKEDAKASVKKVRTTEFEAIYKVAPPEDAGKNVWVLTFRKSSEQGKTGNKILPQHEPKAYEIVGNTLKDITHTKLIANGSKGVIGLSPWRRTSGSLLLDLAEVVVVDLIEYIKETREEVPVDVKYSKYLGGSQPVKKPAVVHSTASGKAKVKAKVVEEDDDENSGDLPF